VKIQMSSMKNVVAVSGALCRAFLPTLSVRAFSGCNEQKVQPCRVNGGTGEVDRQGPVPVGRWNETHLTSTELETNDITYE